MKLGKIEAPVRLALAFYETVNRQRIEEMLPLLSEDCLFESPTSACGEILRGREAIANWWRQFFITHPQAHFEVQDVFGAGFRGVVRWKCTWKSTDGESHSFCGMDVFRIAGERIDEQISFGKQGR